MTVCQLLIFKEFTPNGSHILSYKDQKSCHTWAAHQVIILHSEMNPKWKGSLQTGWGPCSFPATNKWGVKGFGFCLWVFAWYMHFQHYNTKHADLKLKKKCYFFRKQFHYLGHLLSREGISPLPDKHNEYLKISYPTKQPTDCFFASFFAFAYLTHFFWHYPCCQKEDGALT